MSIRDSLLLSVAAIWGLACPVAFAADAPSPEGAVKQSIAEYVQQDEALRGAFLLPDPRDGAVLRLTFDHVHDQVHTAQDGGQYACVDFVDVAGNVYDVDVFLMPAGQGYQPSSLVLHKVNGEVVAPPVPHAAGGPAPEGAVKQAMADYVQRDEALRGGFLLSDPRDGSILRLSFDHVHDQVHAAEDGGHFACVDFKDAAGNVYDVDVHVEAQDRGHRPSRLVLHKVNGEVVAR